MTDLTYINQGLFTAFIPVSKAGETAWNEMAKQTEGTGKVLSVHANATIAQLKSAGYKVRKAAKQPQIDADALLAELGL